MNGGLSGEGSTEALRAEEESIEIRKIKVNPCC